MTPSGLSVRHLPLAKPRPCRKSGTDGSNPVPSTGESANFQSLSGRCVSPATAMTWSSTARGALAIPATPKVAMATAGPMVGACLMALLAPLRNSELLQGPASLLRHPGLAEAFEHVSVIFRPHPRHAVTD